MSISPWETDREPPPMTVTVNEAYLHELQADAARWRCVRDRLGLQSIEDVIDRLIEESKREGK